jgi:hypothetical protein
MGRWELKLLRGLQFETAAKSPADNNEKDSGRKPHIRPAQRSSALNSFRAADSNEHHAVLSVASAISKAATGSTHFFFSCGS